MNEQALGKKIWVIAEGYIPGKSTGPEPEMTSHETACVLNTSSQKASLSIMIYFYDRDPIGPYYDEVEPKRTKHIRFNELLNPEPIPPDTDYASVITSDVPVVVQHTRLDSRQAENALMTTVAFSQD